MVQRNTSQTVEQSYSYSQVKASPKSRKINIGASKLGSSFSQIGSMYRNAQNDVVETKIESPILE